MQDHSVLDEFLKCDRQCRDLERENVRLKDNVKSVKKSMEELKKSERDIQKAYQSGLENSYKLIAQKHKAHLEYQQLENCVSENESELEGLQESIDAKMELKRRTVHQDHLDIILNDLRDATARREARVVCYGSHWFKNLRTSIHEEAKNEQFAELMDVTSELMAVDGQLKESGAQLLAKRRELSELEYNILAGPRSELKQCRKDISQLLAAGRQTEENRNELKRKLSDLDDSFKNKRAEADRVWSIFSCIE